MELGTFKSDFKKFISKFPTNIQDVIKKKAYLAGGALRSLALQQKPKDYDLFFVDRESAHRVRDAASSININIRSFTENAITIGMEDGIPFQIISRDAGMPNAVIDRFDFTCNMNYYFPALEFGEIKYSLDIHNRELVFNPKANSPLSSLVRVPKFVSQGWSITPTSIARIGVAISKLKSIDSIEHLRQYGVYESSSGQLNRLKYDEIMMPNLEVIDNQCSSGYGDFTTATGLLNLSMIETMERNINLSGAEAVASYPTNLAIEPITFSTLERAVDQLRSADQTLPPQE